MARTQARASDAEPSSALPVPEKPSIAVLPFSNLSGGASQEYFIDGMVDDIITGLSRINWLFVIARNSSFAYKGRNVDVKQVGRELGVRYVLEGSARKARDRVRVTGQLIDASTGAHVWAERYERRSGDISRSRMRSRSRSSAPSRRACDAPKSTGSSANGPTASMRTTSSCRLNPTSTRACPNR